MRSRRIGTTALATVALAGLAACGGHSVATSPGEPSASPAPTVIPGPGQGPSADPTADQALIPTDTPSPTVDSDGTWKLVWSDEFNGTSLDSAWASRPTSAAAHRTCATTVPAMATVADGYAHFSIAPDPSGPPVDPKICPSGRYFNAQFGTQNSKTFTYGKFSARIKYEQAEGMHGSFWMQSIGPAAGAALDNPAQTGTEIDVSEYFGDDFGPGEGNGDYHSYVYWPQKQADGTIKSVKTGGAQGFTKVYPSSMPSDGYHVYSVEWTPTAYVFRIDGMETSRVTVGVSQRPEFLLLSLLTSDWEIPKLKPENNRAAMSVDWVRVYQH